MTLRTSTQNWFSREDSRRFYFVSVRELIVGNMTESRDLKTKNRALTRKQVCKQVALKAQTLRKTSKIVCPCSH